MDPLFHKLSAKPFRLFAKLFHKRGAINAFGEARIVFHVGSDHQLTAGGCLFFGIRRSIDQERFEIGARRVNCGGQAGGARPNDYNLFIERLRRHGVCKFL